MSGGEIDTTALIIAICVVIPALIAITVCAIIYFAHRNKDRKLQRQTNRSLTYVYEQSRERPIQDTYIIDFSRTNRYQQQHRSREPPPILEQSPPSYHISTNQTRKQQKPLFSTVRMTPSSPSSSSLSSRNVRRYTSAITPSVYSTMPPSYAEIFLSPHTLPNG